MRSALKHGVDSDWCRKYFASSARRSRVAGASCSASQRLRSGERLTSPSAERSLGSGGAAAGFIAGACRVTSRASPCLRRKRVPEALYTAAALLGVVAAVDWIADRVHVPRADPAGRRRHRAGVDARPAGHRARCGTRPARAAAAAHLFRGLHDELAGVSREPAADPAARHRLRDRDDGRRRGRWPLADRAAARRGLHARRDRLAARRRRPACRGRAPRHSASDHRGARRRRPRQRRDGADPLQRRARRGADRALSRRSAPFAISRSCSSARRRGDAGRIRAAAPATLRARAAHRGDAVDDDAVRRVLAAARAGRIGRARDGRRRPLHRLGRRRADPLEHAPAGAVLLGHRQHDHHRHDLPADGPAGAHRRGRSRRDDAAAARAARRRHQCRRDRRALPVGVPGDLPARAGCSRRRRRPIRRHHGVSRSSSRSPACAAS